MITAPGTWGDEIFKEVVMHTLALREYFTNPILLGELFEDAKELTRFSEIVYETLRRVMEVLLEGEGLEKPARAWFDAERNFRPLRVIRMLSIAARIDVERFFTYTNLSDDSKTQIKNWISGYGTILKEVFSEVTDIVFEGMNTIRYVRFQSPWPGGEYPKVYLNIVGENHSFETLDRPLMPLGLSLTLLRHFQDSEVWRETDEEDCQEMMELLGEFKSRIFELEDLVNDHLRALRGEEELEEPDGFDDPDEDLFVG